MRPALFGKDVAGGLNHGNCIVGDARFAPSAAYYVIAEQSHAANDAMRL
jgi:hypothetical protein